MAPAARSWRSWRRSASSFPLAGGGQRTVIRDFTSTILRGDKIGLIGPNGAGKTTLLKIILGELAPDSGTVRLGSKQSVAYFDQMRDQIDLDATLEDFISPGSEWIEIGNKRTHVKSYLADFLFSPARANAPVRTLSGGERNRLLLARLFARPANVLVLDEPTNDLDIDTLELLEDLLQQYDGTVFLVSHDRRFLDNVVTSTIVHEGEGRWREYVGDVQDWMTQSARTQALQREATSLRRRPRHQDSCCRREPPSAQAAAKRKLSYKEQRELEALPAQDRRAGDRAGRGGAELAGGSPVRQRSGARCSTGRPTCRHRGGVAAIPGASGGSERRLNPTAPSGPIWPNHARLPRPPRPGFPARPAGLAAREVPHAAAAGRAGPAKRRTRPTSQLGAQRVQQPAAGRRSAGRDARPARAGGAGRWSGPVGLATAVFPGVSHRALGRDAGRRRDGRVLGKRRPDRQGAPGRSRHAAHAHPGPAQRPAAARGGAVPRSRCAGLAVGGEPRHGGRARRPGQTPAPHGHPRRHRGAQAGRGRRGAGARTGRTGQPRQKRVSRQHQPRGAHAAERPDGADPAADGFAAQRRSRKAGWT